MVTFIPSTRNSTRDLNLELRRKTQKAIEAVEGDVGNVADVGWPSDFHVMDGGDNIFPSINPARNHGFPKRGYEKRHQWELVLVFVGAFGSFATSLTRRRTTTTTTTTSASSGHHYEACHLSLSVSLFLFASYFLSRSYNIYLLSLSFLDKLTNKNWPSLSLSLNASRGRSVM